MSLRDAILSLSRRTSKGSPEEQQIVEEELLTQIEGHIQVFSKKTGAGWVDIHSVLFFDTEGDLVHIATKEEIYKGFIPENCLRELAEKYNFYEIDRLTYANLDNVVEYDSIDGVIFFDEINQRLKLKVSIRRIDKIARILGSEKDICYLKKDKKFFARSYS